MSDKKQNPNPGQKAIDNNDEIPEQSEPIPNNTEGYINPGVSTTRICPEKEDNRDSEESSEFDDSVLSVSNYTNPGVITNKEHADDDKSNK